MWANWTRCSGRTATFAPQSSSRNGRPGTGTSTASAGRWTPRRALDDEQPGGERGAGGAAGDERVGPAVGDGAHRLDDRGVGVLRTARAGSAAFAIDDGASTTSTPGADGELGRGAEEQHPHAPPGGERRAARDLGGPGVGAVGVERDRQLVSGHRRGRLAARADVRADQCSWS